MLTVQIAEHIIRLIAFLIAYAISVTLAGSFTAWVAIKLGDDAQELEHFLTLNPIAHIDMLGLIFMMVTQFGWGKFIPINRLNFQAPMRELKVLIAFLAKPVMHFALGVFSMLVLLTLFGQHALKGLYQPLHQAFPSSSSYAISIAFIAIAMLLLNAMLGVVSLVVNMCGLCIMAFMERHDEYMEYTGLIMIIVPTLIYVLFGGYLFLFTLTIINYSGYILASLLHLF